MEAAPVVSRRRKSGATTLLWPLLGASFVAAVIGYKPVVIVHGLFDSSGEFVTLLRFINQVSLKRELNASLG